MLIMRKNSEKYLGNIFKQIILDNLRTSRMHILELSEIETVPVIEDILLEVFFS